MVTFFVELLPKLPQQAKQSPYGHTMEYSTTELQRFKASLLKLKSDLLKAAETGQEAEGVVELDQARVGRLSRMDAMQAQAMSVETGRRRRQHLMEIDAALERIETGDFGECFECGELIHSGRIEASPVATLCIGCAEALE
jgi:DnaK suppressor protein